MDGAPLNQPFKWFVVMSTGTERRLDVSFEVSFLTRIYENKKWNISFLQKNTPIQSCLIFFWKRFNKLSTLFPYS